jgi:hypothetical protein
MCKNYNGKIVFKKHRYELMGYEHLNHEDDLPLGYYCINCGKQKS